MSLIKSPTDPIQIEFIKALLYGPPGIGKTTYSLTAPKPLLIDYDEGIRRVQPQDRKHHVPVKNWKDVDALLKENLSEFDTLIHDTVGKLLDFLAIDIIESAPPKAKYSNHGVLTQQGWGILKLRFREFANRVRALNKNMLFVAHDKETAADESTIIRPDIPGASMAFLMREMDLVGYMQISGSNVIVSFNPTERYYGKNTCLLPQTIICKERSVQNIFETFFNNQTTANQVAAEYEMLISLIEEKVASMKDLESITNVSEEIGKLPVIWDSKLQARQKVLDKITELGYKFVKGQGYVAINNQAASPVPIPNKIEADKAAPPTPIIIDHSNPANNDGPIVPILPQ